jgi:hypothetical protein
MKRFLCSSSIVIFIILICFTVFSCKKTKQNSPIVLLPPVKDTGQNWEKSYNKGAELHNAGKLMEASYYFSNALGASPGNFKIIETYCQAMVDLSQIEAEATEGTKYDLSVLQITEGFLQSQIPLLAFEDVEKTVALLNNVREKMNETQQIPQQDNTELGKQWQIFQADSYEVPDDKEKLRQAMDLLDSLKEYTARQYPDVIQNKLNKAFTQVQAALEYIEVAELLEVCKNSVEDSVKTSASITAEYQLQECEQYLRAMISLRPNLPEKYAIKIADEFNQLKKLVGITAETKSNEVWERTVVELNQLKDAREKITEPKEKLGKFQRKINNIQQESVMLQNIISSLAGKSLNEAISRQASLGDETVKLFNDQNRAYNSWAMIHIKACLTKGKEGVGVFANGREGRRTIERALIDEISPIDRRYLTNEVSRCYDEVMGKYLAPNQLNPVKDESSIDEEGNIIHTLKEMNEKEKIPLSQF